MLMFMKQNASLSPSSFNPNTNGFEPISNLTTTLSSTAFSNIKILRKRDINSTIDLDNTKIESFNTTIIIGNYDQVS